MPYIVEEDRKQYQDWIERHRKGLEEASAENRYGYFYSFLSQCVLRYNDPYSSPPIKSLGDLNYVICSVYWYYIRTGGIGSNFVTISYENRVRFTEKLLMFQEVHCKDMPGVRAVLEDIKYETYRRFTGPYEETKKVQNGDVGDDIVLPQE